MREFLQFRSQALFANSLVKVRSETHKELKRVTRVGCS